MCYILSVYRDWIKLYSVISESKSAEPGGTTPSTAEASRLQRLEERALVEAIRDTFLPGLSLSDIVIFATLIVDVFQTADAATIFQSSIEEKNSVLNESEQLSAGLPALSVPQSDEKGNYLDKFIKIFSLVLFSPFCPSMKHRGDISSKLAKVRCS